MPAVERVRPAMGVDLRGGSRPWHTQQKGGEADGEDDSAHCGYMIEHVMRRALHTVSLTVLLLVLTAPLALAGGQDGGEGLYGETSDKVVTNSGFILILFFPLFVAFMSFVQWRLDKRKDARKAAVKARTARADERGGW
jgi:hypothetical protein